MSRNNTGNPIGSGDPRDREDNSKNLDVAVNSMDATWIDRFGTERLTMSGAIDPSGITGAAIGAKNEAQAAALVAQAARDAAAVNADVYADTAAGLAGTTEGDQFQVVSGEEIIRYRHDAGPVATEVARYPTADYSFQTRAVVEQGGLTGEFHDGESTQVYQITDALGNVLAGFDETGQMSAIPSLDFAERTRGLAGEFHGDDNTAVYCWTDANGTVFYATDGMGNNVVGGGSGSVDLDIPASSEDASDGGLYAPNAVVFMRRRYPPEYQRASDFFSTHGDLYAAFDELVSDHPGYITKTKIGDDALGNDINSYRLAPPSLQTSGVFSSVARRIKILIVGGVHAGTEKRQVLGNYLFARDLCKNWDTAPDVFDLRWHAEIHMIPCLTPSAYDLGTRKNANGVNVNRNFPINWATAGSTDPGSADYRGPSAGSELETQAAIAFFSAHPDAAFGVDHHGVIATHRVWYAAATNESAGVAWRAANEMNGVVRREFSHIGMSDDPGVVRVSVNTDGSCGLYLQLVAGLPGVLIETPRNDWGPSQINRNILTQMAFLKPLNLFLQRELQKRSDIYEIF